MVKKLLLILGIHILFGYSQSFAMQANLAAEMGFKKAHKKGLKGNNQTICLFDNNPQFTHPALKNASFESKDTDTSAQYSHGLMVRGIIQAQSGTNSKEHGLAPKCHVIGTNYHSKGKGFMELIQKPGRIINCSCVMDFVDIDIDLVKASLKKNDSIILIAAGNFGKFVSKNPEADWLLTPEIQERVILVGNIENYPQEVQPKKDSTLETEFYYQLRDIPRFSRASMDDIQNIYIEIQNFFMMSNLSWKKLIDQTYDQMVKDSADAKSGRQSHLGGETIYEKALSGYHDNGHKAAKFLLNQIEDNPQALMSLKKIADLCSNTASLEITMSLLISIANEIYPIYLNKKSNYRLSKTSNRFGLSPFPMICASGESIKVLTHSDSASFTMASGTSLATPIISSALALALESCNGNIQAKDLIHLLLTTAHQPDRDVSHYFGSGVLNLSKLLKEVPKHVQRTKKLERKKLK